MEKISLFIPCTVDIFLPSVGEACVRLFQRLGKTPIYHENQTCCGQLADHAGFSKQAVRLAKHFIEVFENDDVVVSPSGSCVVMVKDRYPKLLRDEPDWLKRAESLSGRIYELSQFLVDELGVQDVGASYEGKVTYHESCQILRGLGVSEQPKALIRSVAGAELLPLNAADSCCGFGGDFSMKYPDISGAMVKEKVNNYLAGGADLLITGEPGCLLNISGYLSRHHPEKKAMHLADFLAGQGT